ncbi:MAG: N,N'-diacetylbacillosaminyl-diphospho-undecaprenol alpha-1,3-N-acetylgalactosaminyltransferase [Anaerolineales bacterium]|nr:N,N'-diacetylbacillosaminyl-diphospho-undecaprenol alpha-1,3-N-acetylgalactosaminyltransferase [Anaerolineales bacterium]
MSELSVLLCTEGTYPFVGGGVSTWCKILCEELPQVEYILYAITGNANVAYKYEPPPNARRVIHIPLWGAQEPADHILTHVPFSEVYQRKQATTESVIEATFVPLLQRFLRGMEESGTDIAEYGQVIYDLWRYFRRYDWNTSWKSEPAWRALVEAVLRPYEARPQDFLDSEVPSIHDLTTAMRWMYNFLMPLSAPVPKTDVVHTTIAAFTGLAGIIAKHEYGTPLLVTDHGVYVRERYMAISAADFSFFAKRFLINMSRFVSKLNYLYADVVAPVANFNRRWEVPYGAHPDRIETIYNGINPKIFVPKPKPARTANRPTAVAAARVFPLKDIETMIRSAAVARESIPDIYYLVYGSLSADPPYVKKCRRLIAELNLEGTFEFGGFHNKPAEIYTEGDISVLSSISEGFPYTVLESMSCARPVAGTDVGGVREALEGFGVVAPPRDPEALGQGVVKLLQDDELRLELGRKARNEVLAKYKTSTSVDAYWRLYQRLATQEQEAPAALQPALEPKQYLIAEVS